MKILHLCLGEHYVDNFGYQENCLTKMHKKLGLNVEIIASTETIKDNRLFYVKPSIYENEDGIKVTRLPYVNFGSHFVSRKLRAYVGLYGAIEKSSPDIIFIHGACALGMYSVKNYLKKHPKVNLYVDSHTDYINSGTNWLSMNVLHKILYKRCHKILEPYAKKYWGTLPARCDFLNEIYNIPKSKIGFLPQGLIINENFEKFSIRKRKREEYKINDEDFVIVIGGKLTKRKNFHVLLEAFELFTKHDAKLYVFGGISNDVKEIFEEKRKSDKRIIYAGWVSGEQVPANLVVGDLAVFPGRHSSIWEQSVALGLPCVFMKMDNITQIDLGGNCILLNEINKDVILNILNDLYDNRWKLEQMSLIAEDKGPKEFSYFEIAKKAIEL